ncbi:hypothetical protein LY76DRAFT_305675 [Colletotrichum caudatum]|nr:hypothetical protein LY76DRAFT_305675 [Colletotrichum caudatum]
MGTRRIVGLCTARSSSMLDYFPGVWSWDPELGWNRTLPVFWSSQEKRPSPGVCLRDETPESSGDGRRRSSVGYPSTAASHLFFILCFSCWTAV